MRLVETSSFMISHFGMNPVSGGSPPRESKVIIIIVVVVGEEVHAWFVSDRVLVVVIASKMNMAVVVAK